MNHFFCSFYHQKFSDNAIMWDVVFLLNIFMVVAISTPEQNSFLKTNDQKESVILTALTNGSVAPTTAAATSLAKVRIGNKHGLPKLPLGPTDMFLEANHGTAASNHSITARKEALDPNLKSTRMNTSMPLQDSKGRTDLSPQFVSVSPGESNQLNISKQNQTNPIEDIEPVSSSKPQVIYTIEGGPVNVSDPTKVNAKAGKGNEDVSAKTTNSVSHGITVKENSIRVENPPIETLSNPYKENSVKDGNPPKENIVEHRVTKPTVTILTDDKTDIVQHEKSEIYHLNDMAMNQPGIVFPIVVTVAIVPLFAALGFMALRKGREAWKNRHYRRMDFLLDGMYND